METQRESPTLTAKAKYLLGAPCLAAVIYHAWLRLDPKAGSKDSLILPFLFLLFIQAIAVPISFSAAWKYRKSKASRILLGAGIFYSLVTLYSFFYVIGLAVGALM